MSDATERLEWAERMSRTSLGLQEAVAVDTDLGLSIPLSLVKGMALTLAVMKIDPDTGKLNPEAIWWLEVPVPFRGENTLLTELTLSYKAASTRNAL